MKTGAILILASAVAASVVALPGTQAQASDNEENLERIQLEVQNQTSEKMHIDFGYSADREKGRTDSKEVNGVPKAPDGGFDVDGGGLSGGYGISYVPSVDAQNGSNARYIFENYFNIQASPVDARHRKGQATLEHDGEFKYSWGSSSKQFPTKLARESGDPYKLSLTDVGNPAKGFDKKYRVTVSADNVYEGNASSFGPDVKRLTSSGRAVYKVTVPERTQKLTSVPSDLKIRPYTVLGRGLDPSSSREIGKVLPVGKPKVDHAAKTLTVPKATFFFEYPEGYFPQYYLTVLDEAGLGGTMELSRIPGPPAGLDQSAITAVSAAPATGEAVPANGVAQEALKLKLTASGETVGPDHRPELNALYDHLYFRDGDGKLITGMYEGPEAGGYSTVSDVKGAYVNELGGMRQSSAENNRAYVSTTKRTATTLRAELNVSKLQQSPEARVERGDASDTVQGTASQGVSLTKGIADPTIGAYHHYNGEKPEGVLLNRYNAFAAFSSLPLKNPYGGHLAPANNGNTAALNQAGLFDPTPRVETHLVNGVGTYVQVPLLSS